MTEKLQCEMNEIKKNTMANSTYPKVAVQWLNQALCFYQSFCLVDSEVLRNRHLRVAASRYVPYYNETAMTELIPTINEIIKYGLQPNLTTDKDERNTILEKSLVEIYRLYFEIEYEFDETDYPEFDKNNYQNIRQNIESNFPDFGFYKTIIDFNDLDNKVDDAIGDAIDDLT